MSLLEELLPTFALVGFAGVLLTQALWSVLGVAALIVRLGVQQQKIEN